jgi:hypothetical protein
VKYIELINLQEEERELESKERKTLAEKKRLTSIKKELIPLKLFIDNATFHRKEIKKEIG